MDKLLQVSPKVYEGGIAKVLGKAEKRISPPRPPPQSKWEYEVGKVGVQVLLLMILTYQTYTS